MQYEDQRKKEAEAMRYWEEKKIEEQEKFSDEENDFLSSRKSKDDSRRSPRFRKGGSNYVDGDSHSSSNGLEAVKIWQDKYHELEKQLKESMLSNAQLYKDKTCLVFQVEHLKDKLDDTIQDVYGLEAALKREKSHGLHEKHNGEALEAQIELLKKQIDFRDEFLERFGLHLPTGNEEEDAQTLPNLTPEMDPEEKEHLLKEIQSLKDEIASMKSSSLLGDHQPKDIVQVSTKLVSEYKTKLQISEAENSRLEGLSSRQQNQVTRYKNQVKELEAREDELMKEKRHQAKEIRSLQSESEDQKTEIDLMKRRIDQLKKRRDYTAES